jgi:GGDEF domain-containing protein
MAAHLSLALSNINLRESPKRQAICDPLTNLYNRGYLDEALENEIIRAERKQQSIDILMIDMDHFKTLMIPSDIMRATTRFKKSLN